MITEEEQERNEELEKPLDLDTMVIDTAALSTVAKAILDALETVEEELQILERHELILTSPGASDVLETQRQFNAYRGFDVIVETVDPFESNRTLKGKLVDRNAMDLVINKKGRMVTVPLNFVKCVRLPAAKREKNVPSDVPF
jgi:ribosome maturation factor RimP